MAAKTQPFMSTVHEAVAALKWSCYHSGGAHTAPQSFIEPSCVVLPTDEYMRFTAQKGFDFIAKKDYVVLDFHRQPLHALAFRAYREDSRHDIEPLKQYISSTLSLQ